MENRKTKASTKARKISEQKTIGRGKKIQEPAQHYSSQIATLKANNTSLATALDEIRQEYRKLHQDNLQLKQERQNLLEKVASLEKRLAQRASGITISESSMQLLQEAQCKLWEVQSTLEIVQKTTQNSPEQQSLEFKPAQNPKKVLRFSTPSQSEGCTIYPRTPHPLHNMTCVVDGPQLASTPVKTKLSSSLSMNLSPQRINYSDTEEGASSSAFKGSSADKKKTDSELGRKISPIEELKQCKEEDPTSKSNPNSTLDQLEDILSCNHMTVSLQRPRRKCASLSLSYQEPTLNRKLRRGDPFTEWLTDWNPPDHKERRKKIATAHTAEKRKVLQDIQNRL